jgi:succinoglycan biosynthesis protein ExoM
MDPALTVAVTTYRRPALLARCLESLLCQKGVPHPWRILVVDNDPRESGRVVVERVEPRASIPIVYTVEAAPGIAAARNAAVHGAAGSDYLAFIDDDEAADPRWLAELFDAMGTHRADVVQGRVVPALEPGGPGWASDAGLFERTAPPDGAVLHTATSANVLLSVATLSSPLHFDPRLGLTGGEDTKLFHELSVQGARIVSAPAATVTEHIPLDRQTVRWVLRRSVRSGSVWSQIEREVGGLRWRRTRRLTSALVNTAAGGVGVVSGVVRGSTARSIAGLRRGALGFGMLLGLVGWTIDEYQR